MTNLFFLFAVAAGAGVAVQAAINSRLRFALGEPIWAACAQFTIGLAVLALVALVSRTALPPAGAFVRAPWWMWTGGIFGAVFIIMTVVATPRLGAGLMLAAVIVGQLVAAIVIDHYGLFGGEVIPVSAARVGGVLLLVAGVALIRGF